MDQVIDRAGGRSVAPPPGRRPRRLAALLLIGGVAAALGGYLWWRSQPVVPQAAAPVPVAAAPATPPAPQESAAPIPEPKADQPIASEGLAPALRALLGDHDSLFQFEDFPRRFVTTIDNLGREHAPWTLWPVSRAPGRLVVVERDGRVFLSPDNAARYGPLVRAIEAVDPAAAVAMYRRVLPLLQRSYEQQGFGKRRFHARLLQVIDELLATPEPKEPIALVLTEVKGPVPSRRPWLRYQFEDPEFERASAGQKIMLRVGLANEQRLKAKLRALRAELERTSNS